MKKQKNDPAQFIEERRKRLGVSYEELALSSVGSQTTWDRRIKSPLDFRAGELIAIFKKLDFTKEMRGVFYTMMEELYEYL